MKNFRPGRVRTGKEARIRCGKQLDELVHQYYPQVYCLARRMVGSNTDAEDVSQEVFLKVTKSLHTFRGEASIKTWLHRVTVNESLRFRSRAANRRGRSLGLSIYMFPTEASQPRSPRSPWNNPEKSTLDDESRRVIEDAVAALPAVYRDVVLLADVEGLSNAEIGNLLNLQVPAVKSRLHRGRLILRNALASYFCERGATP